jgi:hypothetical protein
MFLLILIIYFFSILFCYAKALWKDFPAEKILWHHLTMSVISPIIAFAYFLPWLINDFFTKYYRAECVVVDKNHKDGRLHSFTILMRCFWFQDVLSNDTIKFCKEYIQLQDNECFYFSSITRSSSIEFVNHDIFHES